MADSRSNSYRRKPLLQFCEYSRSGAKKLWPARLNLASPGAICMVLLALLLQGCSRSSKHEPVTLSIVDQQWTTENFHRAELHELEEFTRETGIQVKYLPAPESAGEQLVLWRELLQTGSANPDVYGVDVIWSGMLGEYFIDLKPYFGDEISAQFPATVQSYMVGDKLVAMPRGAGIGILYYRTDLLQRYGYRTPPTTWDELETMAARIQAGERARGNKKFWGYVWQGASAEALTCNALEWQASEGGGRIIEDDKTISVNNPQAIRAWQRAARWVGSISPPSVVAYKELDSLNLWVAGDAAFMRNWTVAYADGQAAGSPIRNKFDVALLPGGKAGRMGTLGGTGAAVSRFSAHPTEALRLVRYLTGPEVELKRFQLIADVPTRPELYENLEAHGVNPHFALLRLALQNGVVSRPANVAGTKYEDVSNAYRQAVHSVLTDEKSAPQAAADLEKELVRITGFKTGPPPSDSAKP